MKAVTMVLGLALSTTPLLAFSCKDPNATRVVPVAEASAVSPRSPPRGTTHAQCATDDDCRTAPSYCEESPCACQVRGKSDADPKCSGAPVSCLANPCARKAAACQDGTCQLVVKPS